MLKMRIKLYLALIFVTGLLATGCSHTVQRASLDKTAEPSEILNGNLRTMMKATDLQADVLAPEAYANGRELFLEARELYQEEDFDREDFYEKVEYSTAYLNKAIGLSEKRRTKIAPITAARLSAINAGAKNFPKTLSQLHSVDSDLKDFAEGFSEELDVKEFSAFQKEYLAVEASAVKERYLGKAVHLMENMETKDISDRAPKAYERTRKNILAAENLIERNPRDESEFLDATDVANRSVLFLKDILAEMEKRKEPLSEKTAADLVVKNRKIENQKEDLSHMHVRLDVANNLIDGIHQDLNMQANELSQAREKVAFQEMLESVQANFDKDEAEVYQIGSKLMIKLKQVQFPVNRHEVPNSAKPLLDRVAGVVESMDPTKIEIVGHTDSTGPKAFNKTLSEKRAQSVARYLEEQDLDTEINWSGAAAKDPISVNNSKDGRSINRRVDVIVTAALN